MYKSILIIFAIFCSLVSYSQSFKEMRAEAKETPDEMFVQLQSLEKVKVLSAKPTAKGYVKVKLPDGKIKKYYNSELIAFQNEEAYFKRLQFRVISTQTSHIGPAWGYRYIKGALNVYRVSTFTQTMGRYNSELLHFIERADGSLLFFDNQRTLVNAVEQELRRSKRAVDAISKLRTEYGRITKTTTEEDLENAVRLYNEDAAAGRLSQ